MRHEIRFDGFDRPVRVVLNQFGEVVEAYELFPKADQPVKDREFAVSRS